MIGVGIVLNLVIRDFLIGCIYFMLGRAQMSHSVDVEVQGHFARVNSILASCDSRIKLRSSGSFTCWTILPVQKGIFSSVSSFNPLLHLFH